MLTAAQIDVIANPLLDLFELFNTSVIDDIARRLAGLDFAKPTAAWQMQRLTESGAVYENAIKQLAYLTGKSEVELRHIFTRAGVKAMRFDDSIYRAAGLNPLPLNMSPAMVQTLAAGLRKTQGALQNLTMTTAMNAQQAFVGAADLAYLQVTSGTFDYNTAIRNAVRDVAGRGLTVMNYTSGRKDQLDVAMRRAVLTGVNQTTANMQLARAEEMGQDLVQTSAHAGARPEHQLWQGQIFSRSGTSKKYPPFVQSTGYGTVTGLCGANCVIGDTLVSGPAIGAAYRREYSGELIVLHTSGGKELTVTPNHPILTDKGWVAAGLLKKGDYVICRADLNGVGDTRPDINKNESRIQDVFDALVERGDVLRFPSSAGYFHGDISDHEIDTVFPKCFLYGGINSMLFEDEIQVALGFTPESSRAFSADSTANEVFLGSNHSANSIMRGSGKFGSAISARSFKALAHGLRSIFGQWHTHIRKVFTNKTLRNTDLGGDLILPKTGIVERKKFIGSNSGLAHEVDSPISGLGNAIPFEAVLNGVERTSVFAGNEIEGFTGHIEIDNLTLVERKPAQNSFVHVYNLETECGWYYANGIITHNCRHSFYPFFEGISQNAYDGATREELSGKTVTYQGEDISLYDATQRQREIERKIRLWKRQASAMEAAGQDNAFESSKVAKWQAKMRDLMKQTGLQRQGAREKI